MITATPHPPPPPILATPPYLEDLRWALRLRHAWSMAWTFLSFINLIRLSFPRPPHLTPAHTPSPPPPPPLISVSRYIDCIEGNAAHTKEACP